MKSVFLPSISITIKFFSVISGFLSDDMRVNVDKQTYVRQTNEVVQIPFKKAKFNMMFPRRAVRNCSFRFDINISGWQPFISKPIPISIMGKLDFETNTENEIAL